MANLFSFAAFAMNSITGDVVMSPTSTTITSTDESEQPIDARFIIDQDGGFRKYVESSGTPATTDHGSWWTEHPDTGSPGSLHHARIAHASGTDRSAGTGSSFGSWHAITSDLSFYFRLDPGPEGPNTDTSTYTVSISADGGSTIACSFTLTVQLQNQEP